MNRNDRAHPSITVFEMLPQAVKERHALRMSAKAARSDPKRPNQPNFKKTAARAAGKRAREARRRNRGGR